METFIKILNDVTDTGIIVAEDRDKYVSRIVADTCPEGHYPEQRGEVPFLVNTNAYKYAYRYQQMEGYVLKTYHLVPIAYPKKVYSKLKIYTNLAVLGKWETLVAWMKEQTLENGINLYTAYEMAQEISDQHPLFNAYLSQIQELLELTDEEMEVLLPRCIMDI